MSNARLLEQSFSYRVLLPVAIVLVNAAPGLVFAHSSVSLLPCAIAATGLFIAIGLLQFSTATVLRALRHHWFRRALWTALALRGATIALCVGLLPDILLFESAAWVTGAVDEEGATYISAATPMQVWCVVSIYSVGIALAYWGLVAILAMGFRLLLPAPPPKSGCANCGYDLRATPTRCPECGEVPQTRIVAPPTLS